MKKRWMLIWVLIAGLLLGAVSVQASAADAEGIYVWDIAGIMSEAEQNDLQSRAAQIAETYHCGCYIVTVEDFRNYSTESPYEAAKSIYRDMNFGYGSGQDGEMLMLSMNDRDFAIIAYGDFGNTAFTDYGKEKLDEVYLDNFRHNDWYGGFSDYLTQSEMYLKAAAEGEPFDISTDPERKAAGNRLARLVSLVIGLIAGGATCGGFYSSMKSASEAAHADVYAVKGSLKITGGRDIFQRRTESRQVIQKSSGGGGGTHVDSGGFSGHSGKF